MARKKQLKFTPAPDVEKRIELMQKKYPLAPLSQIINMLLRKA